MSQQARRKGTGGQVIAELPGYPPIHFETQEDYVAWERAYLVCSLFNGVSTCFTRYPPQTPVDGGCGHRRFTKR